MTVHYWATESELCFVQNENAEVILLVILLFSAIRTAAIYITHFAENLLGSQSDIHQPPIFRTSAVSGDIIAIYIPRCAMEPDWRDTQGFNLCYCCTCLDFLWSRLYFRHWLSSKVNVAYYSFLLVQLEGILKEKRREKFIMVVLFFHENALSHRALATKKKLAYVRYEFLHHPSYSTDLPRRTATCFLNCKNDRKVAIFRLKRRSLLSRRPSWTDKIIFLFFFRVPCKSLRKV